MSTVLTNLQTPPSWTKVFVELAVRALMRVHLDYLLWSMPQEPDMEPNFAKLTNAAGVAFADEPMVCAAIVQEFTATRLTFGVHIDKDTTGTILAGQRTWRIARERRYMPLGSYSVSPENADSRGKITCNSSLWVALADVWKKCMYS